MDFKKLTKVTDSYSSEEPSTGGTKITWSEVKHIVRQLNDELRRSLRKKDTDYLLFWPEFTDDTNEFEVCLYVNPTGSDRGRINYDGLRWERPAACVEFMWSDRRQGYRWCSMGHVSGSEVTDMGDSPIKADAISDFLFSLFPKIYA